MILSNLVWWESLTSAAQLYWGVAIIATIFFIFQMALSFIGLDADLDIDIDDADGGFSIFSIKGVISFLMFFGWGGVAALAAGFRAPQALMIAFLIGFLAMVAVGYVFSKLLGLQETGTVNVSNALDREGEVYLTIPANKSGLGKIHLNLEGKTMEFDAVTTSTSLVTGTLIKIKKIGADNVMLVEPVS